MVLTLMRQIKLWYACWLCLLLAGPVAAETRWQLVKEGHGIRIYTAVSGPRDFKSIKAVAVFEGTLEKFIAVVLDIENQPNWVYGTRRSAILKKVSNREILYYVETDLPWPASNRDAVIRTRVKENQADNLLSVTAVGEPRAYPTQDKLVRVPHFSATWQVRTVGKNKLSLTYLLDVNPGGSLPPWIVNLFVTKGPYESFRKLSGLLKN
jgi:hypothetical protein